MTKRESYPQLVFDLLAERRIREGDLVTLGTVLDLVPWARNVPEERARFGAGLANLTKYGLVRREPLRENRFRVYRVERPTGSAQQLGAKRNRRSGLRRRRDEDGGGPTRGTRTRTIGPDPRVRVVLTRLDDLRAALDLAREAADDLQSALDDLFSSRGLHDNDDDVG